MTKLAFPISFRSVSQSTNTHTGIGTLRNGTERENFNVFLHEIFQAFISNNRLCLPVQYWLSLDW